MEQSRYRLHQKTARWKQVISSRVHNQTTKSASREKDVFCFCFVDGVLHRRRASLSVSAVVPNVCAEKMNTTGAKTATVPGLPLSSILIAAFLKARRVSPHCPDPYRRNCFPVGEERCSGACQQRFLPPSQRRETRSDWRLRSVAAFSPLPKEIAVAALSA